MSKTKTSAVKKAASTVKKTVKKGVTKVKTAAKASKAAGAKAQKAKTKVTSVVKTGQKKVATTVDSVKGKAQQIIAKVQHAEHTAVDIAERIGTSMETIGGAILSVLKPAKTAARKSA